MQIHVCIEWFAYLHASYNTQQMLVLFEYEMGNKAAT